MCGLDFLVFLEFIKSSLIYFKPVKLGLWFFFSYKCSSEGNLHQHWNYWNINNTRVIQFSTNKGFVASISCRSLINLWRVNKFPLVQPIIMFMFIFSPKLGNLSETFWSKEALSPWNVWATSCSESIYFGVVNSQLFSEQNRFFLQLFYYNFFSNFSDNFTKPESNLTIFL